MKKHSFLYILLQFLRAHAQPTQNAIHFQFAPPHQTKIISPKSILSPQTQSSCVNLKRSTGQSRLIPRHFSQTDMQNFAKRRFPTPPRSFSKAHIYLQVRVNNPRIFSEPFSLVSIATDGIRIRKFSHLTFDFLSAAVPAHPLWARGDERGVL